MPPSVVSNASRAPAGTKAGLLKWVSVPVAEAFGTGVGVVHLGVET